MFDKFKMIIGLIALTVILIVVGIITIIVNISNRS